MVCLCAQFAEPADRASVRASTIEDVKYLLESVGSGVALLDYDGDGRLDIYLVNGSALRARCRRRARRISESLCTGTVYRNLGAGKWEDVTKHAGVRGACTEWALPRRTSTMTAIPTFM